MTLLVRRFLTDYARTRANLLMLAVIPVVFVIVAADSMLDAARLLGGASNGSGIATVTAGWAAGFLAAVAMYFQVFSARDTDRRSSSPGCRGHSSSPHGWSPALPSPSWAAPPP